MCIYILGMIIINCGNRSIQLDDKTLCPPVPLGARPGLQLSPPQGVRSSQSLATGNYMFYILYIILCIHCIYMYLCVCFHTHTYMYIQIFIILSLTYNIIYNII